MTPAEEPGGRSRDPAVASLLRWYPVVWRQRYGEEFLAMVEDELDGQRPTWRLTVSVAWAGLRQRGRALVSGRALGRGARVIDSFLDRWWASFGAAFVLTFLPAAFEAPAPPGRAWQVTAALDAVIAVTALTGLAVLASGLIAFPACRRFLRAGGWAVIRGRVARAAVASMVAGGAVTGLGLWSRSQTYAQLSVSLAYFGWVAGASLALMGALALWASAARATAGHLDLSARERTAEAVLGVLTSNGAAVMIYANGLLLAAVQSSVPLLLIPVAGLAAVAVRGRTQMRRARHPRRGTGPGRHVYRGG